MTLKVFHRHDLVAILLALLCIRLGPLQSAPRADIDPRLAPLGVTIEPAANCADGCYQIVSAQFEDAEQSQGLHHVWTRILDDHGNQMAGQEWQVAWPGGRATMVSKPPPEWADFPMHGPGGCYNPEHTTGPYSAFVVMNGTSDGTRSDTVRGLGLPQCQHVSFRLEWQWMPALRLEPALWLPVMRE